MKLILTLITVAGGLLPLIAITEALPVESGCCGRCAPLLHSDRRQVASALPATGP